MYNDVNNGLNHIKTIDELIEMGLLKDNGRFVYVVNDNRQYTINAQGSAVSFGDGSTNTVTNNNNGVAEDLQNAFKELDELIRKIDDETTKEQAEMNSEILRDTIQSEDKSKSGRVLKFLVGALGVVQPIITIAQLAGIPVPNISQP